VNIPPSFDFANELFLDFENFFLNVSHVFLLDITANVSQDIWVITYQLKPVVFADEVAFTVCIALVHKQSTAVVADVVCANYDFVGKSEAKLFGFVKFEANVDFTSRNKQHFLHLT